jgi:hypothetical protein
MKITRDYIERAIQEADAGNPAGMPPVRGLSSAKVRRLLNWLCKLEGANYLEIGTHTGSTLIPALWNNPHTIATCIDKWTCEGAQGDTHREHLEANLAKYLPGRHVNVIEDDMFTLDLGRLVNGVNIFFYDGPHTREGQYQGFVRYNPVFADRFIALVDDWNWAEPREETRRAFEDLRYQVEAFWELPATAPRDDARWWNGLYVAIVEKQTA